MSEFNKGGLDINPFEMAVIPSYIDVDSTEALKKVLADVRALPTIVNRAKRNSSYSCWSMRSLGKPWYDYENPPSELMRLRIIERWLARGNGYEVGKVKN